MKKIISLFAAAFMASSMMAGVLSVDFSQQSYTDKQEVIDYQNDPIYISFLPEVTGKPSYYYENGQAIRVYGGGGAIKVDFTEVRQYKMTSIVFGFGDGDGLNGNDNPLIPSIGQFDGTTWTGNTRVVKFTVGNKSDGTNGGHRRIRSMKITYHEDTSEDDHSYIDPSVDIHAYLGYGISALGRFIRNPEVYGEWMSQYPFKYAANKEIGVYIENTEDVFGCPGTLPGCSDLAYYPARNEYCYIVQAGWHWIYFRPNRDGGDDWCRGCIKMERLAQTPDPTNCDEAVVLVCQEDVNVPYNNGKTYTLEGYVTQITEAYQDSYHNMSFYIADKMTSPRALKVFRATCPSADHAVVVGDKVRVTGTLMHYSGFAEFTKGCTYEKLTGSATALEHTPATDHAVKTIQNGQLIIERNGERYNALGQPIR